MVESLENRDFEASFCTPRVSCGCTKTPANSKKPMRSRFSAPPKTAKVEFRIYPKTWQGQRGSRDVLR